MDKIKELLEFDDITATDEEIAQAANRCNVDLSNVSDDQAMAVIAELKKPSTSSLTTAQQSAPTKSEPKQKRTRKNAKQVSLTDAIVHAAKETESELSSMEDVIRSQKNAYVAVRSESLVNEIRNTSTEIVESVTEKLMGEEADTESFRQIGIAFSEALFPLGANA